MSDIELEDGKLVKKEDFDIDEKLYLSHKGTVERGRQSIASAIDLKAFGIPERFWDRLIEELDWLKELLEDNEKLKAEKIIKEERLRKKDKSILDELGDVKEEAKTVITSFLSKEDLAEQILDYLPIHYDESGLWWVWISKDKKWVLKDETDILNFVRYTSPANVVNAKERTEILQALKLESRTRKPKEMKPTWLQFDDEIVDLETGERFAASADYFVTNPIPYKLGSVSDTPVMDRIFEEWVGKEYVQTLYEILAYCLIPDYPIHRIFCFIGSGMNGKSCYLNLLRKFVGSQNVCSTELDTLIQSRFEVTRLYKKLVCQMGETNFGEMSKTSMLKKLSGGDLIGFEYKNKTPFESKNFAKIIIATNNLPSTTDKTIGFYRRWMIIDFPNQFTEAKDILDEIPEEEYNNLAMKCVDLLVNLLKTREFHNEGTIEERIEKYESKSNFLETFMQKYTEENVGGYITVSEFGRKFNEWCKENRHREMSATSIGTHMKKNGIRQERKRLDWMNDGKGGQARVLMDIKWKV